MTGIKPRLPLRDSWVDLSDFGLRRKGFQDFRGFTGASQAFAASSCRYDHTPYTR
jgi:hypothetical protein